MMKSMKYSITYQRPFALSEAIRKLDATVSILQAKVNITQKGILGSMIILIEEESSKAEEVIEYLKQAEIIVEVLEHV